MKKPKNPRSLNSANTEEDATHCSSPAQYAMRAECQADCVQMRALLGVWVTMWREDRCEVEGADGKPYRIPDVDIAFSLSADAPSLNEVRWLLDKLIDCHVAAQSVNHATQYTGERCYDALDDLMQQPSDDTIRHARDSARRTKAGLRADFTRLDDAIERLDAELDCDPRRMEKRAREIAERLLKRDGGRPAYTRNRQEAIQLGRQFAKREYLDSRNIRGA
jgi:hypothetical protein